MMMRSKDGGFDGSGSESSVGAAKIGGYCTSPFALVCTHYNRKRKQSRYMCVHPPEKKCQSNGFHLSDIYLCT